MFNWKCTSTSKTRLSVVDNDLLRFLERSLSRSNWFIKCSLMNFNNLLQTMVFQQRKKQSFTLKRDWWHPTSKSYSFLNSATVTWVAKCTLELNSSTFFFSLPISYIFSRAVKQLCSLNGKKSLKSCIFSRCCRIWSILICPEGGHMVQSESFREFVVMDTTFFWSEIMDTTNSHKISSEITWNEMCWKDWTGN